MAGGAELIVSYLAEGLAACGHRVTVVSTCGPEMEPYPAEITNGVEIIRFFPNNLYWNVTRGSQPAYKKALWHLRDAWNRDAGRRFKAILEERKPDLLHTHLIDGMSAILWRRARQAGIPVIHTAHDYHLLCPRAVMLTQSQRICTRPTLACRAYRTWHLATSRDVNLFCSPSQFLLEKHREAGLQAERTAVMPNGIPLPAASTSQKDTKAPKHFLFASRLTVEKGCQVLLDAIPLLPTELPFALTVAGKGPYEDAFRALAARDPRVSFLGYIQSGQKSSAFKAADCLLVPSLWYENAPVTIIEAAAYGIGVIGSDIGAIPEFVTREENGLLFEAGNPQALAHAIVRVVREESLLSRFAQHGKELAARSGVERMISTYAGHYASLCNNA